ncbi:hypothetical protein LCGC14_2694270, partial [marine sediment metagenome]
RDVNGAAYVDILTITSNNTVTADLHSSVTHDGNTILTDADLLDEDDMASDSATDAASQQSVKAYADLTRKNLLINGDFSVSQRLTTFASGTTPANSDDTYLLDRWLLISDGNDIVDVTQQSGGGVSGNEHYIRLDVETAQKKFGILQIIENKNLKSIIGGTASLSFEAKVSDITKLTDIRAVVLAWDSTADTVTSDIISAWNVEGTRPTLVANWTEENTDSDLGVTASWVKYTIANISIDTASTTNVAVFIYQNDVATNDTTGKFLEITNVQLESGLAATDFDYRDFGTELLLCKRYHEELNAEANVAFQYGMGQCITTTTARSVGNYLEKRIVPGVTVSAAADFDVRQADNSAQAVTVLTLSGISKTSLNFSITVAANLVAGNATRLSDDTTGVSRVKIDAEL